MKIKEEYMINLLTILLHKIIIIKTKAKTTRKIKALIINKNIRKKFLKNLTNSIVNVVKRVKRSKVKKEKIYF